MSLDPKPENLLGQIAQRARERLGPSPDAQSMLKFLRFEENCSKAESILILSRHFGVPYEDALKMVHNSVHWVDRKKVDEQLNKEFWTHARSIAKKPENE